MSLKCQKHLFRKYSFFPTPQTIKVSWAVATKIHSQNVLLNYALVEGISTIRPPLIKIFPELEECRSSAG